MSEQGGEELGTDVSRVLREFINALTKSSMYPPGHKLAADTVAQFTEQLAVVLESRGTLTFGFTPRSLLVDGTVADQLGSAFRQFAQRMHRRNIGTIQFSPGVGPDEVVQMLASLGAGDAADEVGREGLRLAHIRVEPLVYEVLAFGEGTGPDADLDEIFWSRLVEAAFGFRLAEGSPVPTAVQLAAAINERATESPEGARRVFEALAAFASALASRPDRNVGTARRRFIEVLSALSRPATTRVMAAAPTRVQRRRFMRETLEQVPPALLLQLLESVAEADGEPISQHLRWLLGKLAGTEGSQWSNVEGVFATEVMGLLEQWDGVTDEAEYVADPRLAAEHSRTLNLGLEVSTAGGMVLSAAKRLVERGHLMDVLQSVDRPGNDPAVADLIAQTVLDVSLLAALIAADPPDWPLIERIVSHAGTESVSILLEGLDQSEDRSTRRRLLDLLVQVGPDAEPALVAAIPGSEWHLVRNILAVLAQYPSVRSAPTVLPLLRDPEPRVRLEALKVLLRSGTTRSQAVSDALDSGEPALVRTALASLGGQCPPELIAPVLGVLMLDDEDAQMQAIRLVGDVANPLVVPPLLELVRERGGFFRRWRLRQRSPVMLSALGVLSRQWSAHRPVVPVLQMAARSNDPEIRRTVGAAR